ncbi:hypothetical protein SAZ11_54835 [Streptomyces sp. FXJ1.4098]|uniref:hypothetical protein n=1 Tax=Streptomyces sp. NPDC020845 TaxID=3365096 RepID=UPI002990E6C6|nr:hypothetical protein [Streptomyces sp. FXJ1.4098]
MSASRFTVPPTRLRTLLPLLAEADVGWEAYTRANSIRDRSVVADLEQAHCRALSIGFESMNDTTLGYMHEQVKARANRVAFELLRNSSIHSFVSFIVGYPGETPELCEDTRRFLVSEYSGQFALYVFMMNDETMPIWQEADRFGLEVFDLDGEAEDWTHRGMDSRTAAQLQLETCARCAGRTTTRSPECGSTASSPRCSPTAPPRRTRRSKSWWTASGCSAQTSATRPRPRAARIASSPASPAKGWSRPAEVVLAGL